MHQTNLHPQVSKTGIQDQQIQKKNILKGGIVNCFEQILEPEIKYTNI